MECASSSRFVSFESLTERHWASLNATALRLCRNPFDAADLAQDTLERALRRQHLFRAGTEQRAWLLTIMRNLFIDRCRAARSERRFPLQPEDLEDQLALDPSPPESESSAFTGEDVRWAVDALHDDLGRTYRLFALEGCSYREIARLCHVAPATVGTRVMRARRQLRTLLRARHGRAGARASLSAAGLGP